MAKQPTIMESNRRRKTALGDIMKEQEKAMGLKKPAPKTPPKAPPKKR